MPLTKIWLIKSSKEESQDSERGGGGDIYCQEEKVSNPRILLGGRAARSGALSKPFAKAVCISDSYNIISFHFWLTFLLVRLPTTLGTFKKGEIIVSNTVSESR